MGKYVETYIDFGLGSFLQSSIDGNIIEIWSLISLFVHLFRTHEEGMSGMISWPSPENQC